MLVIVFLYWIVTLCAASLLVASTVIALRRLKEQPALLIAVTFAWLYLAHSFGSFSPEQQIWRPLQSSISDGTERRSQPHRQRQ